MRENEQIIGLIIKHVKTLLQNHWPDIKDYHNGDGSIKIGFNHDINCEGQQRIIESTISFLPQKRIKDSVTDQFDTEQMNLEFAPGEAKKRGRPKKTNIIAAAILSGPPEPPEPEPEDAA